MINEKARECILSAIEKEKNAAIEKYSYFNSNHEFWAVMKEEVEELQEYSTYIASKADLLWTAVRADAVLNQDTLNIIRQNAINAACEAVQVAAVIDKYLEGESKMRKIRRRYESCFFAERW